jgi:hypothetical protein
MLGRLRTVEDHHGPVASTSHERVHGVAEIVDSVISRAYVRRSAVQADGRADAQGDEC